MRFLTLFFCLIASFCCAQSFQPGYIITKDSQRVSGSIKFNPKVGERGVVWLKKDNGELVKYKASQVAGFGLPPSSRFSVFVEKATKDTVFAELQYDGAVTVARLDRFYVFSKGGEEIQTYLPLKKTPHMLELEVKDMTKKELALIGSLTDFLKDCPSEGRQQRLRPISFTKVKNELVRYSECKNQPFTKLTRTSFRVGVLAGLQFPNVVFQPQYNVYDGNMTPVGGLEIDVIPASYDARPALNFGLFFGQNKFSLREGASSFFPDGAIDYFSIRVPVSIKFFMRPGHSGFFIQPGLQWSVNSKNAITLYQEVDKVGVFGTIGAGWEQNVGGKNWVVASIRADYSLLPVFHTGDGTTGSQGGIQVAVGYRFHVGGR